MIVHRGIYQGHDVTMVALDRNDIAHILTGTPVVCPNVIIHYYESISDAARYANDVLIEGARVHD